MKNLILSLALLSIAVPVAAQDTKWVKAEKTVSCGPLREIITILSGDRWKESPIWIGENPGDNKSRFTLMVNETTGGWTVLEYQGDTACILGTGYNSRAVDLRPKI